MAGAGPKVFISHSTHDDAGTPNEYLTKIEQKLRAAKFDVFLDKSRIKGGDEWRKVLFKALDEAHAAVLLLSDDALNSKWVGIELAVLTFQYARNRAFKLIPVVLTDTIDTNSIVATLQTDDTFQFIKTTSADAAADEVLRALQDPAFIEAVASTMPRLRTRETYITEKLVAVKFDRAYLGQLRPGLAAGVPSDAEACAVLARDLLGAGFSDACGAIGDLRKMLAAANKGFEPFLADVLDALKPGWVPEQDALVIAECMRASDPAKRSLQLFTDDRFVVKSVFQRAQGSPVTLQMERVDIPPPETESDVAYVADELRKRFPAPRVIGRPAVDDPEALKRRLQKLYDDRELVVVVLSEGWTVDRTFLTTLRAEFPTPTILLAGAQQSAGFEPPITALPQVNSDVANSAFQAYDAIQQKLRKRMNEEAP